MNISVLFEDAHIIVVEKPPFLVCESTAAKDGLADLLAEYTGGYIGTVHRLDRGVGGVMVYAKTPAAAAKLSAAVQAKELKKEYLAVVRGALSPENGEMRDLLFHDRRQNKTFVVELYLGANCIGQGKGHSKKQAEQQAARAALELFGQA